MKSKVICVTMAAAILSSIVPAMAGQKVSISMDGRPERLFRPMVGLSGMDQNFVRHAAIVNMFEIQTSELAANRSSNPFILEYAKEMAHEHSFAQEDLKMVATAKGVSLPQELPAKMQKTIAKLSNLKGAAFDNAYQKIQRAGHEQTATKFKGQIFAGRDEDVQSFTVKTLPAVELHYRMLMAKETMMGPTKMGHGI